MGYLGQRGRRTRKEGKDPESNPSQKCRIYLCVLNGNEDQVYPISIMPNKFDTSKGIDGKWTFGGKVDYSVLLKDWPKIRDMSRKMTSKHENRKGWGRFLHGFLQRKDKVLNHWQQSAFKLTPVWSCRDGYAGKTTKGKLHMTLANIQEHIKNLIQHQNPPSLVDFWRSYDIPLNVNRFTSQDEEHIQAAEYPSSSW